MMLRHPTGEFLEPGEESWFGGVDGLVDGHRLVVV